MFGKKKPGQSSLTWRRPLRCSFCNKSQHDVRKLIAGPKVLICDECVDICVPIVGDTKPDQPLPSSPDAVFVCSLCRMATPRETSLGVSDRAILCAACAAAVEAALTARSPRPPC